MSATFGPPIVLAGPLPAPLPHGLFSAALMVGEGDERWGNGANIRPYPEGPAALFDPCSTGTMRQKDDAAPVDGLFVAAFGVYLTDQCSGRGVGTDSALENRSRLAFQAVEQFAVEREFAGGALMPSNPYLGMAGVEMLAGATAAMEALALLERRIGDTGKAGIIHADRATASFWSHAGGLRVVGDKLLTYLGTPVAAGGGYAGVVPDGQASGSPSSGFAWATGPVEIRRSEIEIMPGSLAEALDRATNQVVYRAERNYLVDWDGQLQAAILVDRSL